jgi:hypothetical protein
MSLCRSCHELLTVSTVKRPHGFLKLQRAARGTCGETVESYCCNACGTCWRRAQATRRNTPQWEIVAPE